MLFGNVTPSGKLAHPWPLCLENTPAFITYPGDKGHVRYGEGIFVGYRYHEKKRVAPQFSLRLLALVHVRRSAPENLTVRIDVTNTGRRTGQEIIQRYVRDVVASLSRSEEELKGFAKIDLAPGETRTVHLVLDRRSFAFWDDARYA